ncbi:MAG TPA: TonB-dependent receptor [Rhodanobacter sp.]|jgi:hypothetical protein|nr:TonB-dependent receptor [Rhodanobacter sp.]
MLERDITSKASIMTAVSGKTANGYTYNGDYEQANADRITWTATYRLRGIFFGMRHGRINELLGIPVGEVDHMVKDAIELTWVQAN